MCFANDVSHYRFKRLLSKVSIKTPLIIERGCFNKALISIDSKERTQSEIKAFLQLALAERFDSNVDAMGFISEKEFNLRKIEQQQLNDRQMRQIVVIHDVKFDNNDIVVDADRLIIAGELRSALKFIIKVSVSQKPRTEQNPYGLILESASPINKEAKKP